MNTDIQRLHVAARYSEAAVFNGVVYLAGMVPECEANRHSGYLVGGTSPFATRRAMPVFIEETILALPRICINGGRRGYLVGIDPQVCVQLLHAQPVNCALAE